MGITQETSYCFQQDSYQDITLHFDESLSAAIVIFCIMSSTIKEPKTDLNKSNITKQSSLLVWSFSSNCNFTEWFYNTNPSEQQSRSSNRDSSTFPLLSSTNNNKSTAALREMNIWMPQST